MNVDIFLYAPTYPLVDIRLRNTTESGYLPNGRPRAFFRLFVDDKPKEIVAMSLHESLVERYGEDNGEHVYRRMELEQKGPFAPGAKYAADSAGRMRDFIRTKGNPSR